jgi:hypothetical protein
MSLTIQDYKNVIKKFKINQYTDNSNIIKLIYLEPIFDTYNKRLSYIKNIKKLEELPCIIKNLKNIKYLKEWIISGLSIYEQDSIYYSNIEDDTIEFFENDDNILEKKSFALSLSEILSDNELSNFKYSFQELNYIFKKLFPKFGITSTEKYDLVRALYIRNFIDISQIELCMNDDEKINKLIRLFVDDNDIKKVPKFKCIIDDEIWNEMKLFYSGEDNYNLKDLKLKELSDNCQNCGEKGYLNKNYPYDSAPDCEKCFKFICKLCSCYRDGGRTCFQCYSSDYTNDLLKNIQKKISNYNIFDENKFNKIGNIQIEDVKELLNKQNFKCYICNDIVKTINWSPYCCYQFSVDRIDNNKPHDRNNILISCYYCNCRNDPRFDQNNKLCNNKCHTIKRENIPYKTDIDNNIIEKFKLK